MTAPWMHSNLVFLPAETASIALLAVVIVGILVEYRQHHIARPAIFGNAILLWQVFFGKWDQLPDWLQIYLNVGTVVGVVALLSYLLKARLPNGFYKLAFYAYGSLTVLVLIGALVRPS
jgi:carbon starvation protein CstA